MSFKWLAIALASFAANVASADDRVSTTTHGVYEPGQKPLLAPAFVRSVNAYLRLYHPKLIERDAEHVKMRADYDYLYDIELRVNETDYEIEVSLFEESKRTKKPTKQSAQLASGVLRAMEKELARASRALHRER